MSRGTLHPSPVTHPTLPPLTPPSSCTSAPDIPACMRKADAATIQTCDQVNMSLPFSPVVDGVNILDDPITLAKVRLNNTLGGFGGRRCGRESVLMLLPGG